MKIYIVVLSLFAVIIPSEAQTKAVKRVVCDENCRVEYQITESVKPAPTTPVSASPTPKPKVQTAQRQLEPVPEGLDTGKPQSKTPTEPLYAVVSPVGLSDVTLIQQALWLETLDGKTIAIVGVSFMTGIPPPSLGTGIRKLLCQCRYS